MDLERLRGYHLNGVAVAATNAASVVRIRLASRDETAVLVVEGVVHLLMDTSKTWDDFVDEVTVLDLPQYGPWPDRVRHLLHHHNNRNALTWLRIDGPGPIEILGSRLTVEP